MNKFVKGIGVCGVVLSVSFAAEAWSVPTTINFDTDPNNVAIATGTQIDAVYSSLGVTFTNTMAGGCGGTGAYASNECLSAPAPVSAPNVVTLCPFNTCSDISEDAQGLVRANFTSMASQVCIDWVPVDPGNMGDVGVLRAYDSAHNLLDVAVSAAGNAETLCVMAIGISTVEFSGLASDFGWFDNLVINFDTVPTENVTFSAIKAMYR